MAPISQERWALLRRLYEATGLTVAEIAVVAKTSEQAIYRHAREDGWRRRRAAPADPAAAPPPAAPDFASETTGAAVDRGDIARRLWSALDRHLQDLEAVAPVAGDARAGQALSTLTRTLEKLIEVERDLKQERDAGHDGAGGSDDDDGANVLAELARRIEALA